MFGISFLCLRSFESTYSHYSFNLRSCQGRKARRASSNVSVVVEAERENCRLLDKEIQEVDYEDECEWMGECNINVFLTTCSLPCACC